MTTPASRWRIKTPEQITETGWYYRVEDDKYVRVESHRFPVMKSGFLPSRNGVNERYVERWETGLICEWSTYPPDWGQQFLGPLDRPRACTCHPDDNPPVPCAQKFALTECRAASAYRSSETAIKKPPFKLPIRAEHIPYEGTWFYDADGDDVEHEAIAAYVNSLHERGQSK